MKHVSQSPQVRYPRLFCLVLIMVSGWLATADARAVEPPFAVRGYYMTFMRMPTFGLPEWKEMIDAVRQDGGNTLLLWAGGGFRSKKYPITWQYNAAHKNVDSDFVVDLIRYAHARQVKVVLCLTPFAYDGVNQYPLDHPELKATQKDGRPAEFWGMHSWGYNLCPSRPQSQKFMLEYARELLFDFYPEADGLMIESSDYAICHCPECGQKYFEKEFQFVRKISEDIWRAKPDATILVYPHYFSGRPVPGFDVVGSRQEFDPRWTLFFTPHSAHLDGELLPRARTSVFWNDAPTLRAPERIRDGARLARQHKVSGYVPSLEPFSCPPGPPGQPGAALKPFHFEWLRDGQMPLDELLIRINRIAYREFCKDPDLTLEGFKTILGNEIFGANTATAPAGAAPKGNEEDSRTRSRAVEDLLDLQAAFFFEADWFKPSPLLNPSRLRERAAMENWPAPRLDSFAERVDKLRSIEKRHATSKTPAEREMARIARLIVARWDAAVPAK